MHKLAEGVEGGYPDPVVWPSLQILLKKQMTILLIFSQRSLGIIDPGVALRFPSERIFFPENIPGIFSYTSFHFPQYVSEYAQFAS